MTHANYLVEKQILLTH